MPAFKKFNPTFERDWVKKVWVFKTNYAQPVPLVNHSKNIPAIQTPIDGLYFASMSQVYPWDRGTNFAVEIGRLHELDQALLQDADPAAQRCIAHVN